MLENVENKIFKREKGKKIVPKEKKEIPLKVSPEGMEFAKAEIKELENYTDDVKEKYAKELKDFTQLAKELVREKGEEYKFEKILVGKEKEGVMWIVPPLPQYAIIPENVFWHYDKIKKIMARKPHLNEYLKMGIKELFSHEKEHRKEQAAKFDQEIYQKSKWGSANQIRLEAALEKIVEFQRIMPGDVNKIIDKIRLEAESGNIVEFHRRIMPGDVNKIIDKIVSHSLISDLLTDGIDEVLDQTDKKWLRGGYVTLYSYLPEIIENILNKHLQVVDEIREEYEKWKKSKEKS